jgi:formate dehydrogenase subunit beta
MNPTRMLLTNGDPLGATREFIARLWDQTDLDGMLIPLRDPETTVVRNHLLDHPDQLETADPFAPVMTVNSARLVQELSFEYPFDRFGVVLRPCELRALREMIARNSFDHTRVFVIGVDCLSTFPAEDYAWRSQRKGGAEHLTEEALQFARQGGIMERRFRPACQMCENPYPEQADISVSVLGLPVKQILLVQARDQEMDRDLQLDELTQGEATASLIAQHESTLASLAAHRRRVRQRVTAYLSDALPRDVDSLNALMSQCHGCQLCMDVCPICAIEYPQRGADGLFAKQDIMHWILSCAQCGMCEQACPEGLPLTAIFQRVRDALAEAYKLENDYSQSANTLQ